jgi:DNA-binding GntR family transcriptional regulator
MDAATTTLIAALLGSPVLLLIVKKLLSHQRRPDVAALAARIADLEERLDIVERSDRRKGDYIEALRVHISSGQSPPPPPWPALLA